MGRVEFEGASFPLKDWCGTCMHCGSTQFTQYSGWKTIITRIKFCRAPKGGMGAKRRGGFVQPVIKCGAWKPPSYMRYLEDLKNEKNPILRILKHQVKENVIPEKLVKELLYHRRGDKGNENKKSIT